MLVQVKLFVGASQSYAANDSNVRVYKDDKLVATMMRNGRPSSSFFQNDVRHRTVKISVHVPDPLL